MTRDNEGKTAGNGEPAPELQPDDVIKCRECSGLVRRINNQHLQTNRCMYTDPEGKNTHDHKLRPDHPETVDEYKQKYPDAPVMSPAERLKYSRRASNEEVDKRRREMMQRLWNGEDLSEIAGHLAEKYGCSESRIHADYSERGDWLTRVYGMEEAEAIMAQGMAQKKEVRQKLMRIANRAESENELKTAIKALKAVDSSVEDELDMHMEMGKIAQEGDDAEVAHDAVRPGGDAETEELEAIDEITGGEGEEIVDVDFEEVDGDGSGG